MENENKQEQIWRRFLLGSVSESERIEIEDKLLADEASFTAVEIAEVELIEEYLHGELSDAENKLFKLEFLRTAARRELFNRTKMLIDEACTRKRAVALPAQKTPWRKKLAEFFNQPLQRIAFAASVLILAIFGAWLILRQNEKAPETTVAQSNISPSPADVSISPLTVPENSNRAVINENKSNSAPKPGPSISPEKTPPRETALAVFVLKPGGIRGSGQGNILRVAPQTEKITLRLNLESNDYSFYTAHVTTVDGAEIFTSARLKSNKNNILLKLPLRSFPRGDYIVELFGISSAGQPESVDDYAFTLQK